MTVTLELKAEVQARLLAQAAAQGVPVEAYLESIVESIVESLAGAQHSHLQETATPEEWGRVLREWSESHGRNTPLLSEEAISRESIYAERG